MPAGQSSSGAALRYLPRAWRHPQEVTYMSEETVCGALSMLVDGAETSVCSPVGVFTTDGRCVLDWAEHGYDAQRAMEAGTERFHEYLAGLGVECVHPDPAETAEDYLREDVAQHGQVVADEVDRRMGLGMTRLHAIWSVSGDLQRGWWTP